MNLVRSLSLLLVVGSAFLSAQNPAPGTSKDDEDVVKAGPKDPFTGGDPKAMAAAGIVAYGPFLWADDLRTEDVDKVLGERRILWIETAHFLIGCNLATSGVPEDAEARKMVNGELARLKKRHAKFPDRASKLEPWVRLHLYAQRAEELYAEFATLIGHDAATGTHLGQARKFPILLFQKKSDLARYLDRFCNNKSEASQRHYYGKTSQRGFVLGAEADEVRDEPSVHAQFRHLLIETFTDAVGGVPYWLSLGLAHHYERQVPSRMIMATIKDTESVDQESQHKWATKMRKRAQHPTLLIPFEELATKTDFGYWAHLQAWSRVDYLLTTDRAKFGTFLAGMKGGGYGVSRQVEQLALVYDLEPTAFDAKWRDWVAKTYK